MRCWTVQMLLGTLLFTSWAAAGEPSFTRKEDVIYGRKFGTALTLDVFTPTKDANGAAVVVAVSGGWFSSHDGVNPANYAELLKRGYTVFAVVHGSQPKYAIPEVLEDMHRAVRYIRAHAQDYKIDPNRIGITGGSAGGHLSLMQGTGGKEGNPDSKDPIERVSSRVQAVACFFPPTDFLNYGKEGEDALGRGILAGLKAAFDFREFDKKTRTFVLITDEEKRREIGRNISPINHVTKNSAPTLIIHGDADKVVPIQQAEIMVAKLKEAGVPAELVVKPGAAHGWKGMDKDAKTIADWFDRYLAKKTPEKSAGDTPAPNTKDEPLAKVFSLAKAGQFLDAASLTWQKEKGCFTCHTNYAYFYAKPALAASDPAHLQVRKFAEDLVNLRWREKGPRWDAEVVATAAALAYNDAHTTGKLSPAAKVALDRMWTVQRKDGGYSWLKCGWPPMESDDHYGITLAALAVGVAPEKYAATEAAKKGMAGIRDYLQANKPPMLHHRLMIVWAASYTPDLMTAQDRAAVLKELRGLQRPDGGWSAAGFGNWKRADKKEQDRESSDGYGTGFAIFILRRAGVPSTDVQIQKGLAWLKANQRESGRWFTRSLNRDGRHFLTHIGSAFAVMAIAACEEKAAGAAGAE